TATAETMSMCNNIQKGNKKTFVIASNCHPQTIDICKTRAAGFDLEVATVNLKDINCALELFVVCLFSTWAGD
ncbi:hypothetical protein PIB30_061556, partial [Stylosanthes scabra]|nr:hypothetical protein [Stylosanthes scabra]